MPRGLKVFQAQFGLFDSVVAAPSQAAALRAWGAHQNLFGDGGARLATDEAAIAVALAHPEVPLRRAVGSADPFSLTPRLPRLPDLAGGAPKTAKAGRLSPASSRPRPKPVPRPKPADRSALDAAEATLAALDAAWRKAETGFQQRRTQLEEEYRAAQRAQAEARSEAEGAVKRARQAFVGAGGSAD